MKALNEYLISKNTKQYLYGYESIKEYEGMLEGYKETFDYMYPINFDDHQTVDLSNLDIFIYSFELEKYYKVDVTDKTMDLGCYEYDKENNKVIGDNIEWIDFDSLKPKNNDFTYCVIDKKSLENLAEGIA